MCIGKSSFKYFEVNYFFRVFININHAALNWLVYQVMTSILIDFILLILATRYAILSSLLIRPQPSSWPLISPF